MATALQSRPEELSIHDRPRHPAPLQAQASTVSTSSQGAAKVKPVTLCVYTMKPGDHRSMPFASGRLTNTQQIMDEMVKELGIPKENEKAFSIWLTSKHLQLQLKPYHLPCKLFKRWKDLLSQYTTANFEDVHNDEPILSFQRNAFFELREERKLLDPKKDSQKSIELLYHEAVFNVIRSRYPFSKEELHSLAGLQAAVVAAERGETDPEPANMKSDMQKMYPPYALQHVESTKIGRLFKQKSLEGKVFQDEFEKALKDAWKKSTNPYQLKILYLQICWHKPFYASVLFRGQVEKPSKAIAIRNYKQVVVAINTECVHLFSASTPPDILLYLTYDQLSWDFEQAGEEGEDYYSSLWIEFDSVVTAKGGEEQKVNKRMQIFSRQAPMMDAMITRCVAGLDEQEKELRRRRVEQGNVEYLPEVSIVCDTGKTQRQEKNYKEHKIQCTVTTQDGSEVLNDGSFFTMPKAFRKRKLKSQQSTDTPPKEDTETEVRATGGGAATGIEEHQMVTVHDSKERSGTHSSAEDLV